MRKTQIQMYYDAVRKSGERDALFMDMLRDGMTPEEVDRLIARNPERYGRYAGFGAKAIAAKMNT